MILGLFVALCMMVVPAMANVDGGALPILEFCPTELGSCTANDGSTTVTNVEILSPGDMCEPDGNITVQITAEFSATASQRYDLGVFVANSGGTLDGKTPNATLCSGDYAPIPNFTSLDQQGDDCGDISSSSPKIWTFTFRASCANVVDGTLDVPTCRFWDNNDKDPACESPPGPNAGTGY